VGHHRPNLSRVATLWATRLGFVLDLDLVPLTLDPELPLASGVMGTYEPLRVSRPLKPVRPAILA
jgi:hypothetical protein